MTKFYTLKRLAILVFSLNTSLVFAHNLLPSSATGVKKPVLDNNNAGRPILKNTQKRNVAFSNQGPLLSSPTITGFSPSSGPVGTTVTISGANFNPTTGSNIVFFGATRATVTNATENSLTVTVPVGATYQPISVLNSSTLLTGYSASPFVTTFSPNNSNISKTFFSSQLDLSPASSSFAEYMTTGDIDGDGKADVVSVNSDVAGSNVSIFRNISNSGAASFDAKIELQFGGAPTGIVVRDLNGDGKPEVIALDAAKVSIFGNTSSSGNISFAPKVDLTITNGGSITVGDLDNDGKPDVVVCIRQSKIVSVFRNTSTNGTLSFANAIVAVTLSANSPENTTIGDFDSDGKADLAVVNKATATVSVFRNISTPGNIAFGTALVLTAGDKPESSAIGDFDGDGKPDIAVANSKSNTVHVFQNTTSGNTISFTAKVDFAADAKVRNIAAADIDGDGKVDIVTAVLSIGTASVFRNTHTSGSISAASFAAKKLINAKLQDVNVTDFDGDGRPDIAGTNIKVVTVLRYSPFITQINDSFNGQVLPSIDSAVSAEVVTSASNYRFRITDGDNVQTIDAETNSFKFTQLGSYESSTSYTIDVKVEVAGMWMDYGVTSVVTTPFPVTQISETFSGKTLLNTDSVITADPVPTATGYRLRVTKDATVQTLDAPTNEFKLKELGNYDYNTTYSLDVAVKKGASVGSFGAASLLSTPAAPITQVAAQYCGATLTDVDGFIRCDVPALATAYHFRVRQGDSVRVIDELVPSTLLYKSGFYKYGTTYTVDVSVYVEGTWSEYGATCNVTSMSNPITQVAALYCGKTLTTLLGEFHADGIPTATTYRFKISNGSNEVIKDKETRLYRLNEISFYTYNTTYSIAVSANVEGNWTPYGASCNVTTTTPVTYLKQNLCGTVLNTFGNITAEWVPTATDYRFRITKNGITEYLESTGTSVNMSDMPGYEYNATYSIDIAPKVAGVWYDYGPACNVTTPAPVTRVSASSCGAILKDVDGFIRAEAFPKAIGYRFRVRQGSNEGEILEAGPTTLLYKTNFYTYGTVYTVDVSANVDGIWTDYGPACDITSKLLPSTQLALNVCGTVLNNNGAIHADNAPTATAYRFRINGNNMQTFDSPNTNATLANKPGYAFNTTYSIDVAAQVNNVWSDYGVACNVTTIAPLTNADLSALTISTGTLSPLFAAATLDYTASVSNATAAITLRPTVADATATIKVNGIAVTSATSSGSIPLNVGANTITILATAQDTSIKKLYNIVVTRDKTTPVITFNTLPAKTYGAADFDPATSTNTETPVTYGSLNTAVATIVEGKIHIVGVGTSNITASQAADATHYAATDVIKQLTVVKAALTIKADNKTKAYGAALPEFTASYTGFITGEDSTYLTSPTTFISTATDQSPVSGTPYHITPQGASSNNYTITYTDGDLTITPVPLTITADDKTKVYGDPVPTLTASYTGFVNSETPADIDVLPTLSTTANAVSPVLGSPYSITAGGALDDNYTFTYVAGNLTVTGSSNAILSSLDLEGILKAKVSGANYRDYTATTSASTVKLTATAQDPLATITVNGTPLTGGTTPALNLDMGTNTINTVVTATDGTTTTTYSIVVTRKPPNNALLNALIFAPAVTKQTVTGSHYRDYIATVPNATSNITVAATLQDPLATLKINEANATSGVATAPITLNVGPNTINTEVTAQDGTTINVYSIVITRLPSGDATLAGLNINPGVVKAKATGSNYRDYTATVANTTKEVTVTAIRNNPEATIKVNNVTVTSGTASPPIPLTVGSNTITTTVTAGDGSTKTYSVVITRPASGNNNLKSVALSPGFTVSKTSAQAYQATVNATTDSIRVKPTLEDAEATVTINGQARVFAYSTQITLHTGDNPITILVTAPNGVQKSYTLTITKPGPPMRPASVKTGTEENTTNKIAVTVNQALSPNGDGINDVLAVAGIENYPTNSLSVINSKGVQVRNITSYNNQTNAFDGHSQSGTAQPAGTYFYLLQYKDGKDTVSKSGYFVLKY